MIVSPDQALHKQVGMDGGKCLLQLWQNRLLMVVEEGPDGPEPLMRCLHPVQKTFSPVPSLLCLRYHATCTACLLDL